MPIPYTLPFYVGNPVFPALSSSAVERFFDETAGTDFGFDILTIPDLDVSFTPRRDSMLLADVFARRLFTPRGRLWRHPNYGFDVRDYLNDEVTVETLSAIKSGVEGQAEQDERFVSAIADVSYNRSTEKLSLRVSLRAASGPFTLVVGVTKLTTDLLVEV